MRTRTIVGIAVCLMYVVGLIAQGISRDHAISTLDSTVLPVAKPHTVMREESQRTGTGLQRMTIWITVPTASDVRQLVETAMGTAYSRAWDTGADSVLVLVAPSARAVSVLPVAQAEYLRKGGRAAADGNLRWRLAAVSAMLTPQQVDMRLTVGALEQMYHRPDGTVDKRRVAAEFKKRFGVDLDEFLSTIEATVMQPYPVPEQALPF